MSGILSQSTQIKRQLFIGPLSRFKPIKVPTRFHLGIFLSGPEPARTKLEAQLLQALETETYSICLVRGTKQQSNKQPYPLNWTVYDRVNSQLMNELLLSCRHRLSRSGYTSIMDYASLGVGALLIPTPGQTEQEYLADYLNGKSGFEKSSINSLAKLEINLSKEVF